MSDEKQPSLVPTAPKDSESAHRFTQDEVNRIVADRLARAERTQQPDDYEAVKAQAARAEELTQRLASLESELGQSKLSYLRMQVAAEYGISVRRDASGAPSDADFFLTGTDADTLNAQARRLVARVGSQRKFGNLVPDEGKTPTPPKADPMREFVNDFFGNI